MISPSVHLSISLAMSMLLAVGGCAPKSAELSTRLTDFDPDVRIRAVLEVTRTDRRDLMPELVERLGDDDPAVRLCAILALERFTGTRLGYSPGARGPQMQESIDRWRRYLAENEPALAQQARTAGSGSSTEPGGQREGDAGGKEADPAD